jgi:hypothetical protein
LANISAPFLPLNIQTAEMLGSASSVYALDEKLNDLMPLKKSLLKWIMGRLITSQITAY